jgi:hypothetical protein
VLQVTIKESAATESSKKEKNVTVACRTNAISWMIAVSQETEALSYQSVK